MKNVVKGKTAQRSGSVAPLKSLYFHWTAICSSSIVFTPRSLFLLFVLLFSGLIVEDLTTAATSPQRRVKLRDSRTTVIELNPNTYFSCFSICIRTVLYLPGVRQTLVTRHLFEF